MIVFRNATIEDVMHLELNDESRQEISNVRERQRELILESDVSVVLYDSKTDEMLTIMGIKLDGKEPTFGHAWAIFSRDLPQRKDTIQLIRKARAIIRTGRDLFGLKKMDMTQRDGNLREQRWAKVMGFRLAETMPDFWQGNTYLRYEMEF